MNVSLQDVNSHRIYFQWYDHVLFVALLLFSVAIGIYFSLTSRRRNITDEYFMGDKEMFVVPIAMSLVASHVSSITLLSVPTEVYKFGSMYILSTISIFFVCFATSYVYLPVFYNLKLNSMYEYLNLRFNASIRSFCSLLFVINMVLYMSIVVYVPALAYTQATGTNIYYVIALISAICTFYTTIGGIKAVVWTDTLQFIITAGAIVVVFVLGLVHAGGFTKILEASNNGERLSFNFSFDLTTRETAFAVLVHWFLSYVKMTATGQDCVLKFLSLPTLKKAQQSIFLFGFSIIVIKTIVVVTGLIIFTLYNGCDPGTAGLVSKDDQLVPFYVAHMASNIPGLTGLFISGVFCTGLSTLSAALNALSATIYQDFISKYFPHIDETGRTNFVVKFLVVVMGFLIAAFALLVEHLGPILPLAIRVSSITAGSFLGLFSLGMLFPKANSKGAFWGILSSTLIVGWMFIGAQWSHSQGFVKNEAKYLSVDECPFNVTISTTGNKSHATPESEIFYIYKISHYYYSLIGTVVCIVVGLFVSLFTGDTENEVRVSKELLSPIIHFMLDCETSYVTSDDTIMELRANSDCELISGAVRREYRSIIVANKIVEQRSIDE